MQLANFYGSNDGNASRTMVDNTKKHRRNSHLIIHCLTSEGVSRRAREWAQRRVRAKRAVRSKRMNEWCERTDERLAQYFSLYSWLFSTIVSRAKLCKCYGGIKPALGVRAGRLTWMMDDMHIAQQTCEQRSVRTVRSNIMSEWRELTSEWSGTYVWIFGSSGP